MDCVYAFGPEASPFLYDPDAPGRLLTGNTENPNDVPRNSEGRALIGDPRNDENLFVSQMQLMFIRFHNQVLDSLIGTVPAEERFEHAQREVRFHYQYLIVNDFLKRVCDPVIYQFAMDQLQSGQYPLCYAPDACHRLDMPVEFSVAAYRFGHTLVRSNYPANAGYPEIELFDEEFGTEGFSAIPEKLVVNWKYLLEVDDCIPPLASKAIDHLLADELIRLPNPVVGKGASDNDRSLAFRNLLRGNVLSLPSGQAVASALQAKGYDVSADYDLKFDEIPGWTDSEINLSRFETETPLFLYIMREGGIKGGGHLGRVGSAILLEIFFGMLQHCETSYLKAPGWEPSPCIASNGTSNFTLADIARYIS